MGISSSKPKDPIWIHFKEVVDCITYTKFVKILKYNH